MDMLMHVVEHLPHFVPAQESILIDIVFIEQFVKHLAQLLVRQCLIALGGLTVLVSIPHLGESVSIVLVGILRVFMVVMHPLCDLVVALFLWFVHT
jgi:hypothetical protein